MAFKPASRPTPREDYEPINYPTPKSGNRRARVSLIIDLGTQEREDFEEDDGTKKAQKPCQQVAVFADLVNDVVDYGGNIGKQQYRLLLNKSFNGKVQGINFTVTPPKDAKGKLIEGKPWSFHPANLLTKLAKAVGEEDIIYDDRNNPKSLDISLLLDKPFLAQVEVKETEHKEGKKDKDGNVIVYKNVNYKGASQVPTDDDDNPIEIAALTAKPLCITFDDAKKEDIQFIRANLRKQIKLALNYPGSKMQEAIEAWEAENLKAPADSQETEDDDQPEPEKPKATAADKKKAKAAKPKDDDEELEDAPF